MLLNLHGSESQVSVTIPLITAQSFDLAVPYGCECYEVSGSGLGLRAGEEEEEEEACVVGSVCLVEIRIKNMS